MQLCLIISRLSIDKKITTPDYLSFVSRHIVIESNIATNSSPHAHSFSYIIDS